MRNITLQDKASSPNTELRLVVDEEEGGTERWRELRSPKLPPRRTQGALTVSEQDPLVDFTWAQDDWSDGGLRPYYREGDAMYATANGVDARWEGVLSMGMERSTPQDWLIRGAGAEGDNDTGSWTQSGTSATFTRQTTTKLEDDYAYKYVVTTASSADSYVYQDIDNFAKYQGRTVIIGIWVKTGTLGSSYAPNLYIDDGNTQSSGTAITASDTDWTFTSVTHTIHASSSDKFRIKVGDDDAATGTTACTFYFDGMSIQVDGGGGSCAGMATHDSKTYLAQGRVVAQWDENDDVWKAVYIDDGADATDIIHFDDNVYVAFGYGSEYVYGSGTSWTASTLSSAIKYAKYFAVARNNAGNLALWKTETANTVKSSTAPTNGGSWSSAYTIGSADRVINALHTAFDTILIGKTDGLWIYNRQYAGTSTAENAFAPVSSEWDKGVHTGNFSVASEWHGFLYINSSNQSLIRWGPGQVQDITSLIVSPRVPGYGGEVRALVASPHELFIAADIPETSESGVFGDFPIQMTTTTKKVKILSLRQKSDGSFNVHTLDEVTYGEIDDMHIYNDTASNTRYLLTSGIINRDGTAADHVRIHRWQLPTRSAAPFIDAESTLVKSGTLETSTWHGGVPGTSKAFLKMVCWVDNMGGDSNQKITVKYGLDGDSSSTFTLGALTATDNIQTLYFNDATTDGSTAINPITQAVGRSIQLELTLSTDSASVGDGPPKLFAFELHSTLRPAKLKVWEVFVRIGEDMIQESGYYDPVSKTKQLTDLDTLEDQVYPIYLKHSYDGHAGFDEESSTSVQLVDRERVSIGDEFEVHRLVLQEADTSA